MKKIISLLFTFLLLGINFTSAATDYSEDIYSSHNGEWYHTLMTERGVCNDNYCYVTFEGNSTDNAYVMQYNLSTQSWGAAQLAGINPLSGDAHGNPAIILDCNNRVHVVYGAHNSQGFEHRMSTNPDDISSWDTMSDIGTNATYPQLFLHDNCDMEIFYREDRFSAGWGTRLSTDNGSSWSSFTSVLNQNQGGTPDDDWYACAGIMSTGALGVNFVFESCTGGCSPTDRINNYYIYRDGALQADNWKSIDGTTLSLPLTKTDADTYALVQTTTEHHQPTPPKFDNNDRPVLFFNNAVADGDLQLWRWNGSSWTNTVLGFGTYADHEIVDNKVILYDRGGRVLKKLFFDENDQLINYSLSLTTGFNEQSVSISGARLFKNSKGKNGPRVAWFSYSDPTKIWVSYESDEKKSSTLTGGTLKGKIGL